MSFCEETLISMIFERGSEVKPKAFGRDEECGICQKSLEDQNEYEVVQLEECRHFFHRTCLTTYVSEQIATENMRVCCTNDTCNKSMTLGNIAELLTDEFEHTEKRKRKKAKTEIKFEE